MPQDQPGPGPSSSGLEAILLVGGQGTRLRPLTIGVPKPLLPTAGVPFLAHQLGRVAEAGVSRVVLATAYRATEPRSGWRSVTSRRTPRWAPAGPSATRRPGCVVARATR